VTCATLDRRQRPQGWFVRHSRPCRPPTTAFPRPRRAARTRPAPAWGSAVVTCRASRLTNPTSRASARTADRVAIGRRPQVASTDLLPAKRAGAPCRRRRRSPAARASSCWRRGSGEAAWPGAGAACSSWAAVPPRRPACVLRSSGGRRPAYQPRKAGQRNGRWPS